MKTWIISTGHIPSKALDYWHYFQNADNGVAASGWNIGDIRGYTDDELKNKLIEINKEDANTAYSNLLRFRQVSKGDIVIAKTGMGGKTTSNKIFGIGVVREKYFYHDDGNPLGYYHKIGVNWIITFSPAPEEYPLIHNVTRGTIYEYRYFDELRKVILDRHPDMVSQFKLINYDTSELEFNVHIFKYARERWGPLSEIKSDFQKNIFVYQGSPKLQSYNIELENNDTMICLFNEDKKIYFLTKIRIPSYDKEGYFDYINPLFLDNPVEFEQISQTPIYLLFKPKGIVENTRTVLFDLLPFKEYYEQIKKAIIDNNKNQETLIRKYLPDIVIESPNSSNITSSSMDDNKNMILYGPPGTGKTFSTKKKAIELIGD